MKIEIIHDDDPQNPRTAFDEMGTMLYTSSRYVLGDKRVDAEEIERVMNDPEVIAFPVYAYIHGGVSLSMGPFSCPWDSGQCGVIYVTRAKAREEYGKRITKHVLAKLEKYLTFEVERFSAYLAGETYGYRIVDDEGEELDSCWGYYGYADAEGQAKEAFAHLEKQAKADAKQAKADERARKAEERRLRDVLRAGNRAHAASVQQ